jgi:hypothetical protein
VYKFAIPEESEIKVYEFHCYEDAESWIIDKIKYFKIKNRVSDESKDRYFIQFKNQLEESLKMQDEEIMERCPKCPESDHDGIFCRCEMRNIRIARAKRNNGESPWKDSLQNSKKE